MPKNNATSHRERTSRKTCVICDLPLVAHTLDQARACAKALEDREPPYCRLEGPRDPKAFMRAVQRR